MIALTFNTYWAQCHDPKTGTDARFTIKAISERHADIQARDRCFGFLAPPPEERRAELEVTIEQC
jgi:hypothetical protein